MHDPKYCMIRLQYINIAYSLISITKIMNSLQLNFDYLSFQSFENEELPSLISLDSFSEERCLSAPPMMKEGNKLMCIRKESTQSELSVSGTAHSDLKIEESIENYCLKFRMEEFDFNDHISGLITQLETMEKPKRIVKDSKRTRKTNSQIQFLKKAYKENSDWDKEAMEKIADRIGLDRTQVYKWYWDVQNGKLRI